ncbi:uncharacterized protein LACBIDRAFT_334735 [Laccaria bicolor S238N-H82]|uniref:Predicted protein n=1 Tax=Laccaria bicolor (strain S238N-H82 / ATCC MYA-4686) TaxID=486041 RepID=B0E039_LACBS|nr:uncharacterized protein LACBIDRAFT_334735 [Laccaria bicolor S238N-H82]EDQ99865.1 predicted protein [Laccaria bicolor S238N-H82]|eukprot:XP_001889557.1 predicted protein [Laccaria bicolor S238N-H82]
MRFMTSGCGKWADPYCEESKAVQLTHNPRQFQQGQFIIRLVGRHTEPLLKKIWVAEPALMGSTYTSAHQQAPSTMACLYGQGAQCCWGKVTNTCVYVDLYLISCPIQGIGWILTATAYVLS